jgi:hypothetical protein
MPKRILAFILCLCVSALSSVNIHAHLPQFAHEASYAQANAQSQPASENCPLCWAQNSAFSESGEFLLSWSHNLAPTPFAFMSGAIIPATAFTSSLSSRAPPAL